MKKIKFKVFILLACLLASSSPKRSFAHPPQLWFERNLPGGDILTNGKINIGAGFFGTIDVSELVKDHPNALALAKKQAEFDRYATFSFWLGQIPSAVFLGYSLGSRNTTLFLISVATFVGGNLLTGYFKSQSRHYMYEAVNTFNGVHDRSTTELQASSPFASVHSVQPQTPVLSASFSF
ncbi:MAG: hypothetical protein ACO3A2_09335 [Bdellovibrionia bacterium]